MTARVRPVAAASIRSGSMFRSDSRTSHEDRSRARVNDHVRGRRPGDRRRDHLVARPDARCDEREVHGGRARCDGERVPRSRCTRQSAARARRRAARSSASPSASVSATASISSSPTAGGWKERKLARNGVEDPSRAGSAGVSFEARSGKSRCIDRLEPYALGRLVGFASASSRESADGEHEAGAVGAASQRPEPPAWPSVDTGIDARLPALAPSSRPSTCCELAGQARRGSERRRRPAGSAAGGLRPDSPERGCQREPVQVDAEGRPAELGVVSAAEASGELDHTGPAGPEDDLRVGRAASMPRAAAAAARRPQRRGVRSALLGQACASATPNAGGSAVSRSVTVSGEEASCGRERVHGDLAARRRAPRSCRRDSATPEAPCRRRRPARRPPRASVKPALALAVRRLDDARDSRSRRPPRRLLERPADREAWLRDAALGEPLALPELRHAERRRAPARSDAGGRAARPCGPRSRPASRFRER